MIQFANTVAWLDLLYSSAGSDDGEIVIIGSSRRKVAGVYQPSDLLSAARCMHDHPGCYAKINLMDTEAMNRRGPHVVGNRDEVKSIVSFHLDVDAGKDGYASRSTALWALSQMPKPPTLVINSNGKSGGFHAYWCLGRPHRINGDRDGIQKQANRWQKRLKALVGGRLDSTANLDRVLRCVNVPRTDGGEVCLEYYEPSRLYELDDLK